MSIKKCLAIDKSATDLEFQLLALCEHEAMIFDTSNISVVYLSVDGRDDNRLGRGYDQPKLSDTQERLRSQI